jgi:acetyl esterase/lipase
MPNPLPTQQDIPYGSGLNRQTGHTVTLYMDYYASASSPAPAVVLIHGGGFKSGCKADLSNTVADIQSDGFAFQILSVDYLLDCDHTNPPAGTNPQMCEGPGSGNHAPPDPAADVLEAVAYIRAHARQFGVARDPTTRRPEVVALGFSAGGTVALDVAARGQAASNTDVAAAGGWSPPNQLGYRADGMEACAGSYNNANCSSATMNYLGEPLNSRTAADYAAASPYTVYQNHGSGPPAFVAGSTDELIPEVLQTELGQLLQGEGVVNEVCIHDGSFDGSSPHAHARAYAHNYCDSPDGNFHDTSHDVTFDTMAFLQAHVTG